MRDPEKKKAAQKKYDLKRTSKIVSLSFRASAEEEAEVRKVLGRFRAVIASMRKARSSSLKEELTRLVERLEAAGRKTSAPAPDPEAAERAAFTDGSRF